MSNEEWRSIPSLADRYQASSLGRIRSVDRVTKDSLGRHRRFPGRVLSPVGGPGRYLKVNPWVDGIERTCMVHRLVAEAFLGPPPAGMQVAHGDGDKTNNRIANLRYATPRENNADQLRHRTRPLGEQRAFAVLTADAVREIDAALRSGGRPQELAAQYGVARGTIRGIAIGRTWRHVTGRPHPRQLELGGAAA